MRKGAVEILILAAARARRRGGCRSWRRPRGGVGRFVASTRGIWICKTQGENQDQRSPFPSASGPRRSWQILRFSLEPSRKWRLHVHIQVFGRTPPALYVGCERIYYATANAIKISKPDRNHRLPWWVRVHLPLLQTALRKSPLIRLVSASATILLPTTQRAWPPDFFRSPLKMAMSMAVRLSPVCV